MTKVNRGDHQKEDNYNSDEFTDNPELSSLYVNDNQTIDKYSTFNYQPDRTIQNLLSNNLSMITPQPYKSSRASVPRKLFFGKDTVDHKVINEEDSISGDHLSRTLINHRDKKGDQTSDSPAMRIRSPPPMPGHTNCNNLKSNSLNRNQDFQNEMKKHSSIRSSNSFKENKTRTYLVSDQRKASLKHSNSVNSSSSKVNLSDCHDSLMDEIRAFDFRNSLKRVGILRHF